MKVIEVENLSKLYDLGQVGTGTLSKDLNRAWARITGKADPYATLAELNDRTKKSKSSTVFALKDINFSVEQGDVVGIIGKNGAGKSTLLKILSQITSPSSGNIKIKGRVASLLEVGTGMHPEMTARQNIYLNGSIMGMRRHEITRKLDEIVDFAGIGKYLDTPIKRFSSGMQVRLGFAVAAHLEPEILIVDEVLAVGDAEFQKKAIGKMQDVSKDGDRTVLFVSHNMAAVKELCTKGIFLSNGTVKNVGEIGTIINDYIFSDSSNSIYVPENVKTNVPVALKKIKVLNDLLIPSSDFTVEDFITIEFDFENYDFQNEYSLFVIIKNMYGAPVFSCEKKIRENKSLKLKLNNYFLTRGIYCIHAFIHIPKIEQIDVALDVCQFSITDATSELAIHGNYEYGNVFGTYNWIK
jgi:lipopolysaccharide transport system ATP-binding protein